MGYCKKCGTKVEADDAFCPECGSTIKEEPKKAKLESITSAKKELSKATPKGVMKPRNTTAAILFGIFFGPFSYLYVKKYGKFVFWLFVGTFLVIITNGVLSIFLSAWYAFDCYREAKKINQGLQK